MQNKQEEIKSFCEMLESCFTYGGIDPQSYNFKTYLKKYEDILSKPLFDKIYKQEAERLKGYKVIPATYTDTDGLSYNSLIKQ